MKKFKFIDLFAGIGGFHQAVAGFGGECVFASEWDDEASKTYHQNYGIEPRGDITKIDENDIPRTTCFAVAFLAKRFPFLGNKRGLRIPEELYFRCRENH